MGQHLGWRATFLGVSVIGLAAMASLALAHPARPRARPRGGPAPRTGAPCSSRAGLARRSARRSPASARCSPRTATSRPMLTDSAGYADSSVTLLLALFGVGATVGQPGRRTGSPTTRCARTLFGGLASLVVVLALFPVLMSTQWSAAVAVVLLGAAAFVTGSPAPADGHGEGVGRPLPGLLRQPGRLQPRQRRRRLDRRPRPGRGLRRDVPGTGGCGPGRARPRRRRGGRASWTGGAWACRPGGSVWSRPICRSRRKPYGTEWSYDAKGRPVNAGRPPFLLCRRSVGPCRWPVGGLSVGAGTVLGMTRIDKNPKAAAPPSRCGGWSSTTARPRRSTAWTWTCARAPCSGVLGPNGAGKTTLVRCLSTLLTPDAGTAVVAGYDVVRQPRQLRRIIGLTGQYASVDEKLSGWENLYMIGRLLDLPRKDARAARRRTAGAVLAHRGRQAAGEHVLRRYAPPARPGRLHDRPARRCSTWTSRPPVWTRAPATRCGTRCKRMVGDGRHRPADHPVHGGGRAARDRADGHRPRARSSPSGGVDELKAKVGGRTLRIRPVDPAAAAAAWPGAGSTGSGIAGLATSTVDAESGAVCVPILSDEQLTAVVGAARRARLRARPIGTELPSLDEVFLSITGQKRQCPAGHRPHRHPRGGRRMSAVTTSEPTRTDGRHGAGTPRVRRGPDRPAGQSAAHRRAGAPQHAADQAGPGVDVRRPADAGHLHPAVRVRLRRRDRAGRAAGRTSTSVRDPRA